MLVPDSSASITEVTFDPEVLSTKEGDEDLSTSCRCAAEKKESFFLFRILDCRHYYYVKILTHSTFKI